MNMSVLMVSLWYQEIDFFGKNAYVDLVSLLVVHAAVDAEQRAAGLLELDMLGAPHADAPVRQEPAGEEKPQALDDVRDLRF